MRVLQINNYGYVRGGSDRYYIDLGRMLSSYGHEVYYMTADNPENIVDSTYAVKGINIYSPRFKDLIKFFYSFNARKVIKDIIKTKKTSNCPSTYLLWTNHIIHTTCFKKIRYTHSSNPS
jgi:hypothetical protein